MKELLLATNNPAKIADISKFLGDTLVNITTLREAGVNQQAPEDGRTFLENALSKASWYSKLSGLPALADDGGIEIDALGGKPGVDSHRWISGHSDDTDEALITFTLDQMKDIPDDKRGAQMHLVLVLYLPDGRYFSTEGVVRGVVTREPSVVRTEGFPFRSLFYIPEIGKYYDHGVMTQEEIEHFDHRRQAVEAMKPILVRELGIA